MERKDISFIYLFSNSQRLAADNDKRHKVINTFKMWLMSNIGKVGNYLTRLSTIK